MDVFPRREKYKAPRLGLQGRYSYEQTDTTEHITKPYSWVITRQLNNTRFSSSHNVIVGEIY